MLAFTVVVLIFVVPPASVVKVPRPTAPPMTPARVVAPVELRVRVSVPAVPSTATRLMGALPALMVRLLPRVRPVPMVTRSLVVLITREPVVVTRPAPFCVTLPSAVMSAASVSRPALVKVTVPPLLVASPALTLIA